VADLIRRARAKANITAGASPNPRIVFKGQQVGHSLTLGELGVIKCEKVAFACDGAEEEDEEL